MYKMIAVALSACDPKFFFENIVFRCMNESVIFCAPSGNDCNACRQELSITNFPTSSYSQLSQTPSEARTIAMQFFDMLSFVVGSGVEELLIC